VLFTVLVAIIPLSSLVTFIPSLALAARRLHDIAKSGWWQILPLGELIGFLLSFISFSMPLFGLLFSLISWLFPGGIVLLIVWLAKKGDEGQTNMGQTHVTPPHNSLISLNSILAIRLLAQ